MGGKLEGKVVLITGASSGIGAATAQVLVEEGARVAVTARRVDRLEELRTQLGVDASRFLAIGADVREQGDAQRMLDETIAWGGRLDVLINNAGLSRGSSLETTPVEDIDLMLDTNVFALINLTRLALPAIRAAQGDIVNVASTIAKSFAPGSSVYGATKAAVVGFSESLRKEVLETGVRVMTVYPGLVETEFFDGFDAAKRDALKGMAVQIHALSGRDLGESIAFILSRPRHVNINEMVVRPTLQP